MECIQLFENHNQLVKLYSFCVSLSLFLSFLTRFVCFVPECSHQSLSQSVATTKLLITIIRISSKSVISEILNRTVSFFALFCTFKEHEMVIFYSPHQTIQILTEILSTNLVKFNFGTILHFIRFITYFIRKFTNKFFILFFPSCSLFNSFP